MAESGATSGAPSSPPRCGRYELLVRIGKGGMASVYLARMTGEAGFSRLYALKVLHPHLGEHPEFVDMLMDEARIASRLHHPNVVSTVDLGNDAGRYFMVMDYVEGVALDRLLRRQEETRPPEILVTIAIDALRGLHAAHQLTDDAGQPLHLVHRDVTPGNVIVGADGTARIADFGVAKARARITKTNPGIVKGKAGYIAPEVVLGRAIDGRADVFSMGVLLYNALTGTTLFDTDDLASSLTQLLREDVPPPSTVGLEPPPLFDAPILAALHREPQLRYESAREMAQALSDALALYGRRAEPEDIGQWVEETFGPQLAKRRQYAATPPAEARWDPDQVEPPSTSAMVRKDPTGRVVDAMPEATPGVDEDLTQRVTHEPLTTAEELAAVRGGGRAVWAVVTLVVLGALAVAGWWLAASAPTTDERAPIATPSPSSETETEATPTDPGRGPAVDLAADVLGREERPPAAPAAPRRPRERAPAAEAPADLEAEAEETPSTRAPSGAVAPERATPQLEATPEGDPAEDAPAVDSPSQTAPGQAPPSQATPSQAAPSQATPSQAAPSQAAPSQAAPSQAAPGDDLPPPSSEAPAAQ